MRSSTMRQLVGAGLAGFVLVACGTDDPEFTDDPPAATTPAPAPDAPAAPGEPAPGEAVTAEITPLADSGISGSVSLQPANGGAEVEVMLHGASTGVHQGHIHTGTCAQPGGVVAPLEPVTLGADGHGVATARVDVPLATLRDGQHIVVYHEADASPGAPVACAAIPAA
jgi:hypothetical protein